jgi:hypothetical protein
MELPIAKGELSARPEGPPGIYEEEVQRAKRWTVDIYPRRKGIACQVNRTSCLARRNCNFGGVTVHKVNEDRRGERGTAAVDLRMAYLEVRGSVHKTRRTRTSTRDEVKEPRGRRRGPFEVPAKATTARIDSVQSTHTHAPEPQVWLDAHILVQDATMVAVVSIHVNAPACPAVGSRCALTRAGRAGPSAAAARAVDIVGPARGAGSRLADLAHVRRTGVSAADERSFDPAPALAGTSSCTPDRCRNSSRWRWSSRRSARRWSGRSGRVRRVGCSVCVVRSGDETARLARTQIAVLTSVAGRAFICIRPA